MSQPQKSRSRKNTKFASDGSKTGLRSQFITGSIVALVIIAALGAFALVLQHNASSSNNQSNANNQGSVGPGVSFSVSFSGPISGPMAINTVDLCGPEQNASTYEVDASGTINTTPYEFSIIIPKYQSPGTYSTVGTNATAAVALTNTQTMESWGSQGQQGSAIVNSDGQSGTISATMVDSSSKALEQVTGTWSCG